MKCKYCGSDVLVTSVFFRDSTEHLRSDCTSCNKFNGFIKRKNANFSGEEVHDLLVGLLSTHEGYLKSLSRFSKTATTLNESEILIEISKIMKALESHIESFYQQIDKRFCYYIDDKFSDSGHEFTKTD